jgi:hypothetical protein
MKGLTWSTCHMVTVDIGLLSCNAVWTGGAEDEGSTFLQNVVVYLTSTRRNPEDKHRHITAARTSVSHTWLLFMRSVSLQVWLWAPVLQDKTYLSTQNFLEWRCRDAEQDVNCDLCRNLASNPTETNANSPPLTHTHSPAFTFHCYQFYVTYTEQIGR